jgi:hypothetical protein
MIDDGHYSIGSNPFFKILGYDHGNYFFYSWLWAKGFVYTHRSFTIDGLIILAPLEFWSTNFPETKGGFKRLTAMSAMVRLANSRGLYTYQGDLPVTHGRQTKTVCPRRNRGQAPIDCDRCCACPRS